jgi:hypothetical protein
VDPGGLSMEGDDGVGVEPGGMWSIGGHWGVLVGDHQTIEEALHGGHLGD